MAGTLAFAGLGAGAATRHAPAEAAGACVQAWVTASSINVSTPDNVCPPTPFVTRCSDTAFTFLGVGVGEKACTPVIVARFPPA